MTAHTEPCPDCGRPTLLAPNGVRLAPQPHDLAVLTADGKNLDPAGLIRCRQQGIPRHHRHRCGPGWRDDGTKAEYDLAAAADAATAGVRRRMADTDPAQEALW